MTEIEAANMMNCLTPALKKLDEAVKLAEMLRDPEESKSVRKTLAIAIGTIVGDAVGPICHRYPDLDPYKGK